MGLVSNSLRNTLNLKLRVSVGVKIKILQNSTVAERAGKTEPTGSPTFLNDSPSKSNKTATTQQTLTTQIRTHKSWHATLETLPFSRRQERADFTTWSSPTSSKSFSSATGSATSAIGRFGLWFNDCLCQERRVWAGLKAQFLRLKHNVETSQLLLHISAK